MFRGYKTSRDYKRLKELLDEGYEVIILRFRDIGEYHLRQAHVGRKGNIPGYEKYYYLGVLTWSEDYITGAGWDFESYCKANDVEFIEPTEE